MEKQKHVRMGIIGAIIAGIRVGDVNIYYYGSLVAGDWSYWEAKAGNPSPLVRDLWVIPRGNDAVGITAIMTE